MRFIHISDLHLGRTLRERSLLEDQEAMLAVVARAARDPDIAALVISGDIYDRGVPPSEAVGLLDDFMGGLRADRPDLVQIVIPGNHDSAARLAFGAGLFARSGVHIRTRALDCLEPIEVEAKRVEGMERVCFWALPFLMPGSLPVGFGKPSMPNEGRKAEGELDFDAPDRVPQGEAVRILRSQDELMRAALEAMLPRLDSSIPNVLVAHCFARGGSASESERAFIGATEEVDAALFDAFDYAALGHLHRPQSAGTRAQYCGAPLAYAFDEEGQERGFLVVEVGKGRFAAEFRPIRPLHALRRVSGPFAELRDAATRDPGRSDFIEAILTDPEPVINPVEALRAVYPNLLSVRQAAFEPASGEGEKEPLARERSDAAGVLGDFGAFYREVLGDAPDEPSMALVAELIAEADRASHQA